MSVVIAPPPRGRPRGTPAAGPGSRGPARPWRRRRPWPRTAPPPPASSPSPGTGPRFARSPGRGRTARTRPRTARRPARPARGNSRRTGSGTGRHRRRAPSPRTAGRSSGAESSGHLRLGPPGDPHLGPGPARLEQFGELPGELGHLRHAVRPARRERLLEDVGRPARRRVVEPDDRVGHHVAVLLEVVAAVERARLLAAPRRYPAEHEVVEAGAKRELQLADGRAEVEPVPGR